MDVTSYVHTLYLPNGLTTVRKTMISVAVLGPIRRRYWCDVGL